MYLNTYDYKCEYILPRPAPLTCSDNRDSAVNANMSFASLKIYLVVWNF